jgi:hypothetical protein
LFSQCRAQQKSKRNSNGDSELSPKGPTHDTNDRFQFITRSVEVPEDQKLFPRKDLSLVCAAANQCGAAL